MRGLGGRARGDREPVGPGAGADDATARARVRAAAWRTGRPGAAVVDRLDRRSRVATVPPRPREVVGVGGARPRRSRRCRSPASAGRRSRRTCGSISRISSAPTRRSPGTPFSRPAALELVERGRARPRRWRRSACRCARPRSRARRSRRRARARRSTQSRAFSDPGLVVDAGVDDAARVARLVGADRRLALEHGDPQAVVAQRQLARHREPDDPGADDDEVAFARRLGARHAMRD